MADSGRYVVSIDFGNGLEQAITVRLQDRTGKVFSDFVGGLSKRLHGCSHGCGRADAPKTGDKLNMKGFGKLLGLDLKKAVYHDGTNIHGRPGFFTVAPTRGRAARPTGSGDWEATDEPGPGPIEPKTKKLRKSPKNKNKKNKNKKK